jgi:hypothetical protein
MKPRTKLQIRVVDLSTKLPHITINQTKWAYKNALDHIAYKTKSSTTCLDCGHVWGAESAQKCKCPGCDNILYGVVTKKKKLDQSAFVAIVTVAEEFQVIRTFEIKSYHKCGQSADRSIREIAQQWYTPDGKLTVVGRTVSGYWGGYSGDMEIRTKISTYYMANKFDLEIDKVLPGSKVWPIYKRNGFSSDIHGVPMLEFLKTILIDGTAETLAKCKQYSILRARMGNRRSAVSKFWGSIKICIRNKYIVKDAGIWLDYLELLEFFGKDLNNANYVCPADIKHRHDKLVAKKRIVQQRQASERQRKQIAEAQLSYEKNKGKFFGLYITDGELSIKVLESVREFMEEGDVHKHCVFTNAYYNKPDSLVFSARIAGKPLETVELSLKTLKVVQSRGMRNTPSEYHDQILNLMKKNVKLIKQRLKKEAA